jgi:hypothetical protein
MYIAIWTTGFSGINHGRSSKKVDFFVPLLIKHGCHGNEIVICMNKINHRNH